MKISTEVWLSVATIASFLIKGLDVLHHNFCNATQTRDDYDRVGPNGEGNSNDVQQPKQIVRSQAIGRNLVKVTGKVNQLFLFITYKSLSFFSIQVLLIVALSFFLKCTFMNGLPTICLIRVVNETPSNLT